MKAFKRICRKNHAHIELLLVSGYSGVGKSSLVHEIHRPITSGRGYFISGKFDQYQRNVPYYAIQQAFDEFAAYLLTESDERLESWRTRILEAVGKNGQLLNELVPKIQLVLGEQPDVAEVGPQEAQNRFNMMFQNFVGAVAGSQHPLVVFLDDVQWIDPASLNLLNVLLNAPDLRHCLIVCAYRDNEVDASHPFIHAVEELKKGPLPLHAIQVGNLPRDAVDTLVADTLQAEQASVLPLSALLYQKTYGNAFFCIHLLQALFEEHLLRFEYTQRRWAWDLGQIQEKGVTDNVADLMERKLSKLSAGTQEALKLAACIGNQFDLAMLAAIAGLTPQETLTKLWEALQEGLLVPLDESYKLVNMGEAHARFRFLHDRVQQGAYALIGNDARQQIHLRIGTLLWEHHAEEELEDHLFEIAEQFNMAQALLDDEQKALARDLNVRAGLKAKASAAYEAAAEFFEQGAACLPPDAWTSMYSTTLALYSAWAEASYMATRYEQAEALFETILAHSQSVLDKVKVYQIMLVYYNKLLKLKEAAMLAVDVIRQLGVAFPDPDTIDQAATTRQMERFERNIASKEIGELIHLPEMTDPNMTEAVNALANVMLPFWISYPDALVYELLEIANLSFEHGLSAPSTAGFALLGSIFCAGFGKIDLGYQIGELALRIQERFNNPFFLSTTIQLCYITVRYWKHPLRECFPALLQGFHNGVETGNLSWAGYNMNYYCMSQLSAGIPLQQVKLAYDTYRIPFYKLKQEDAQVYFNIPRQATENLLGYAENPLKLVGEAFDEDAVLTKFLEINYVAGIGLVYIWKFFLYCIFDEYPQALTIWNEREFHIKSNMGHFQVPQSIFFSGITFLQTCGGASEEELAEILQKVTEIQEQFSVWAGHCPANFQHMSLLLSAERARVEEDDIQAMTLYDRAVQVAKDSEFLYMEALSNECAAKFYLNKGREKVAQVYMAEARYAYQRWGCVPKVTQLEERYPQWFGRASQPAAHQGAVEVMPVTTTMTTGAGTTLLDVGTMIKASQTLSQEVRLEQVLQRLMELVVENAGAQNGVLLLKENHKWHIQAQVAPGHEVQVLQGIPLNILVGDPSRPLSVGIVEYVVRTGESVVLPDAARDERFGRDHYMQRKQPKSVQCQPIFHKGALTGILYLENNLTTNAFTPDRLELLNILCAQAAISLENARLVENMREQERLQKEMELARQIQTAILPKRIEHPDFEIEAVMLPAEEVGGDYYDGLIGKDGKLWLGIGDVSGHGMTPGLIMMMAQTIHTTITTQTETTPRDVIVSLNNVLYRNVRDRLGSDHFMTFTTLRYLGEGRFQFAGAHLTMLLYRQARGVCDQIDTEGAFLNFIPDISHAVGNAEFTMEIGDTLVLYTDGLTEAHKQGGKILDIRRFSEIVERHAAKAPSAMRDAILTDVLAWSEQQRQDDMTLLIVRRTC